MTEDRVNEVLAFNAETGALTWRVSRGSRARSGQIVGTPHNKGYLRVRVDGKNLYLHRLAWVLANGSIPQDLQIDHINGDRADNRLCNLRCVSASMNQENRRSVTKRNKCGVMGVTFAPKTGRFIARVTLGRRSVNVGSFGSALEANLAYVEAKRRLHAGNML